MGDLNRGESFANGEQVTAARLNKMQDDATVKAGAIGTTHLADGAVTPAKLSGSFAFAAGQVQIANGALVGGNASNVGVAITPDGTTVEIATTTLRVKDLGISTAKIADGAVVLAKLGARAVNAAKFAAVTTARLLGRFSAGAGDFEEISLGAGLSLSGAGVLSVSNIIARQALKTDTQDIAFVSISDNTFINITGLSLTLTPASATSKFLVFAVVNAGTASVNDAICLKLTRTISATEADVGVADAAGSRTRAGAAMGVGDNNVYGMQNVTLAYYDTPSHGGSAVTYSVKCKRPSVYSGNSISINKSNQDPNAASYARASSNLIVVEFQ